MIKVLGVSSLFPSFLMAIANCKVSLREVHRKVLDWINSLC